MRRLTLEEARALAQRALAGLHYHGDEAAIIADHLLDAELRGQSFAGLPRILGMAERLQELGDQRAPIRVTRETDVSVQLDGGDNVGYVVGYRATTAAIEKASQHGFAVVGASNTWYTGLLAYYLEKLARAGFMGMCAGHGPSDVAPAGSYEARLGTNPLAFGFPSDDDPVIWDAGTSAVMHGELLLRRRLGEQLAPDLAYDPEGAPTRDPEAALAGAIRAWGGHKGAGLSIVVQLLGALAGAPVMPETLRDMGFLLIAVDPELLVPAERFRHDVSALRTAIRAAAPIDPHNPPRMPFDRSLRERADRLQVGIDVADQVYDAVSELAARATGPAGPSGPA